MDGWSWQWSRDNCQRQGGDLVSFETEEEWNFINDEIQRRNTTNYRNKWSIGLAKKAGNWTWVNGGPLTIRKWGIGEPSSEHDAAFMYKLNNNGERGVFGSVNGKISVNQFAYICEISKGELIFVVVVVVFNVISSTLKRYQKRLSVIKTFFAKVCGTYNRIYINPLTIRIKFAIKFA